MRFLVCLMALMAGAATALLGADAVECPLKIEVSERLTAQAPGWSVVAGETPHVLAGLTFFDGKPEEKASLAPDTRKAANGGTVASWTFAAGGSVWVACRYAATDLTLTKQLPRQIRACSVTYSARDTIDGLPAIEKVACR